MSAHFFGAEVKKTKRYQLGELLGRITRHLLLMTATPHAGKEEDFQLFLALLDADRFEGRFRDGVHAVDAQRPDAAHGQGESCSPSTGKPLFPERRAYTVDYQLSDAEATLYDEVTDVRPRGDEPGRPARRRRARVGGATSSGSRSPMLQRRLASSPEAIYQSLVRRREAARGPARRGAQLRDRRLG